MTSVKVVFLGEGRVGKTSIGKRWAENTFDAVQRSTVAAAFFQKAVNYNGKLINVTLWDTAGQEEYHSLAPIYYKDAQAAILVYSVIDQGSFEKIAQWRTELVASRGEGIKIIIAANKIDIVKDRVISRDQGEKYAASIGAPYFEVSAKTGDGIHNMFSHLAEILATLPMSATQTRKGRIGLEIDDTQEPQKKDCSC